MFYHQLLIVGPVGNDPEIRYTPSGVPVVHLSIPISKYQGVDETGTAKYGTVWVDVTLWRKQAEYVGSYVTKGDKVIVVGELENPQVWVSGEGDPKAKTSMTAQFIRKLNFGDQRDQQGLIEATALVSDEVEAPAPAETQPAKTKGAKAAIKPGKAKDIDIPF